MMMTVVSLRFLWKDSRMAASVAESTAEVESSKIRIILDDDHIAGRGTHQELMKTNKIYQEIYQSGS